MTNHDSDYDSEGFLDDETSSELIDGSILYSQILLEVGSVMINSSSYLQPRALRGEGPLSIDRDFFLSARTGF